MLGRIALVAIVATLAVPALAAARFERKQLGGPPEEFSRHSLPNPADAALIQSSALYYITFNQDSQDASTWSFSQKIPVDTTDGFTFTLATPLEDKITELTLTAPDGSQVDLESHAHKSFLPYGDSEGGYDLTAYAFPSSDAGEYTVAGKAQADIHEFGRLLSKSRAANDVHAMLMVDINSSDQVFSHISSYIHSMRQHDNIGVVCNMFDSTSSERLFIANATRPAPLRDVVSTAFFEVVTPNGKRERFPLHDDGLHSDGSANDGVFGGSFQSDEQGAYTIQTVLSGTSSNGRPFERTAEHLVSVVENDLTLTGKVGVDLHPLKGRLNVNLGVKDTSNGKAAFRAYAQLWGTAVGSNQEVPVAWASAIVNSQGSGSSQYLTLEYDLKWLLRAKAFFPLKVKDVYVQEMATLVPLDAADGLTVDAPTHVVASVKNATMLLHDSYDGAITDEMRFGIRPARLSRANATNDDHKLVMLHGYCSSGNPWKKSLSQFGDAAFFMDPEQSRSHDEFAQEVLTFVDNQDINTFSLVGHSQGGVVSVHILNYYWSGADESKCSSTSGKYRTQSLASPFGGSSGAGGAAELLAMLGQGCGANSDLTTDGANLWLVGISQATAAKHGYYFTEYDKGGPLGKGYCNLIVNTVLDRPNDGASETDRSTLDGANFLGKTVGQCHIEGMNWPASYLDANRNSQIVQDAFVCHQ